MARDPKQLRNNWQRKLGDIVLQLSDDQIKEISKYYNSLDSKESGNIDSRLMMGYNDTVLHEMANKFAEENNTTKLPKIKRKRGRPPKNKKVNLRNVSTSPEALVGALLGIENVNIENFEKQSIEDEENISIDDVVGENDPTTIVEGVTPNYTFDEFVEKVDQKISPEKLFDIEDKKTTIVKDDLDKDEFKSEIFEGIEKLLEEIRDKDSNKDKPEKVTPVKGIVDKLPKNEIVTEYREVEKIVEVSPEKDNEEKLFEGIDNLLKDIRGEEESSITPKDTSPSKNNRKKKKSQSSNDDDVLDDRIDNVISKIKDYKKSSYEDVESEKEQSFDELDDLIKSVKEDPTSLKPNTEQVEPEDEDAYEDLDDLLNDVREFQRPEEKKEEQVEPEDEDAFEDLDDLLKDVREFQRLEEKKDEEVEPEDIESFEKLDTLLTEVRDETDSLKPKDSDETSVEDDDKLSEIENLLADIKKSVDEDSEEQNQKLQDIENLLRELKEDKDDKDDSRDELLQDIEELLKEIREDKKDEESETTENDDEEVADTVNEVIETLLGIDSVLKDILGQEKEEDEREKTETQKSRQKQEEEEAEKDTKKNVFGALKKIKPPKMGFLDRIKKFFTNIVIGSVVTKLLNWVNDPKNQETIDGVLNFVENHMGKILMGLGALVGLSIGAKLLIFLGAFVPLIKAIGALLFGPLGIIALIIGGTALLSAKVAPMFERAVNQQRFGGDKVTEDGLKYSGGDVKTFKDELGKMVNISKGGIYDNPGDTRKFTEEELKEIKSPEFREFAEKELKKVEDLQKRIQITKSVNDQLFVMNERLKSEEERLEEIESKENPSMRDKNLITRYKESITRIEERRDELKTNKEQSVKIEEEIIKTLDFEKLKASPAIQKILPDDIKQSLPGSKPEPPTASPLTQTIPTSTEPTGVEKVIIGAGHAPSPENAAKGLPLGSDNRPVQGTADDNAERNNPDPNYKPTGVTESQATKQVVDALKMMVKDRGLEDKIGFEDIYSYEGLTGVPSRVESKEGQQYVDLHFDARQTGKEGVLPSRNESATDKSLMKEFGRYSKDFNPAEKGVTRGGGTLVELGRIDDPKIRGLLEEVKKGEIGPETNKMAERVLRGILPSIQSTPQKDKTQASLPISKDMKTKVNIPSPPSDNMTIAGLPMGGMGGNNQKQLSSSSQASQKGVQSFSPVDLNNMTITSVKSIYNVIA